MKFLEKKTQKIFENCKNKNINIFRTKWLAQSEKTLDVPTHHSQGLVFLSNKNLIDMFQKNKKMKKKTISSRNVCVMKKQKLKVYPLKNFQQMFLTIGLLIKSITSIKK